MVKKLLTVNPRNRITVQGALEHPWLQDVGVVQRAARLMGSPSIQSAPKTVKNIQVSSVLYLKYIKDGGTLVL